METYTVTTKYSTLTGALSMRQRYPDGTPALVIGSGHDMEILSINLSQSGQVPPDENHVFVKDYSEHEGLADELERQGIVKKIRPVSIGYGSGWLVEVVAEVIR